MGEVKGRATDDQGVTMVSVLWDGDSTEVETNEKHVYPLQDDDEPYEFDEEASIKEYEDEILMSKKPKAKKTKKGAPSSGTGAGGSSGTQASHAPSRPVDPKLPKFILPEVEWNVVSSFKSQRPGPEVAVGVVLDPRVRQLREERGELRRAAAASKVLGYL
jgi:hypothetical protein